MWSSNLHCKQVENKYKFIWELRETLVDCHFNLVFMMKEHSKPSDRLPCSIWCDMFLQKITINIMIESDYAFRKWILQQWDECSCYMLDHWIWQYFVFLLQCSKFAICFIRILLRKFQEKVPLLQFTKSKSSELKFIWNLIEAQWLECFEELQKYW